VRAWWLVVSVGCHLMGLPLEAHAAVSLSLSGLRGGSATIDLGDVDLARRVTQEEVTVQMTSTAAEQYRLTQVVSSPLINEQGTVLDPSTILHEVSRGHSGTVRFRGVTPLSMHPIELLLSDPAGQSDTLTILYSFSMSTTQLSQAGTYAGSITYTLQTVNGSSVDTRTVPMRLVVQPVAMIDFDRGSPTSLRFGRVEPGASSPPREIRVVVASNMPGPTQVTQLVRDPWINDQGQPLPLSAVHVTAVSEGARLLEGELSPQMVLATTPQLLSSGRIDLSSRVTVPAQQPAGLYRGTIWIMLGVGGGQQSLQIPVELEVVSVLALSIERSDSPQVELTFRHLTPGMTSQPQTLSFKIQTNVGTSYEVFHELASRLTTQEGRQLPEEALVCTGDGGGRGYLNALQQPTAIAPGRRLLYRSDGVGTPAKFSLSCSVHIPADAVAGLYQSSLLFTVTVS